MTSSGLGSKITLEASVLPGSSGRLGKHHARVSLAQCSVVPVETTPESTSTHSLAELLNWCPYSTPQSS